MTPVNILLVDDEPRNLEVLEGILQSPEYRLVKAGSAQEALIALLQQDFALLVLDIQMPEVSGLELAHMVKRRTRTQHVPIIFLTAFYDDERRMLEGYNVGAVDYLTKPVNAQVLRSKVSVFVELHRKNAALAQEIRQRETAEAALRDMNDELEERVAQRTAELRAARDHAERAGRAKDDFLAALSHELRTPLNPVLLIASESADNRELAPDVRAQFATIRKNVELEARLIDDLLDLTRITCGKLALEVAEHDLHTIVTDALETVRPEIGQKSIDLRLELDAEAPRVKADHVRLQQVVWNLLRNAVKFTPAGGTIVVRTRGQGATDAATAGTAGAGRVELSVSDTGIGLSPAEIGRIFEAFAQGDHASSGGAHRFGGLGLGLTISRSLVELHAGTLRVSSEGLGKGATFVVDLPRIAPAASQTAAGVLAENRRSDINSSAAIDGVIASASRPAPAGAVSVALATPPAASELQPKLSTSTHAAAVLLVEDHEPTRKTLEFLLRRRSYAVSSCGTLDEARSLAGREKFGIVISDIGLPDGSGFELMTELRARHGLRGIALTGYGMEEDVDRSREAGFDLHLTKPIHVQSLDRALAALA